MENTGLGSYLNVWRKEESDTQFTGLNQGSLGCF